MSKSRDYCVTLYDENIKLEDLECLYLVYQNEICPETGRSHRQAYVEFKSPKHFNALQKLLPGAHIEKRKGTRAQARAYCMKEDTRAPGTQPVEIGEWIEPKPKHQQDFWKGLQDLIASGASSEEVYNEYPGMYVRYGRAIDSLVRKEVSKKVLRRRREDFESARLTHWQHEVVWSLTCQDDREVLWIYDIVGGQGKTFLSSYLQITYDCFVVGDGKSSDIAHAYDSEHYIVFDYSRCRSESVSYALIEHMKNGRVFSGKYDSEVKYTRGGYGKVVVFANFEPDFTMMSRDRWNVFELKEGILNYQPYANSISPNFNYKDFN